MAKNLEGFWREIRKEVVVALIVAAVVAIVAWLLGWLGNVGAWCAASLHFLMTPRPMAPIVALLAPVLSLVAIFSLVVFYRRRLRRFSDLERETRIRIESAVAFALEKQREAQPTVVLSEREIVVLAVFGAHYELGPMTRRQVEKSTGWALINVDHAIESLVRHRYLRSFEGEYAVTQEGRQEILSNAGVGQHMNASTPIFKRLEEL